MEEVSWWVGSFHLIFLKAKADNPTCCESFLGIGSSLSLEKPFACLILINKNVARQRKNWKFTSVKVSGWEEERRLDCCLLSVLLFPIQPQKQLSFFLWQNVTRIRLIRFHVFFGVRRIVIFYISQPSPSASWTFPSHSHRVHKLHGDKHMKLSSACLVVSSW